MLLAPQSVRGRRHLFHLRMNLGWVGPAPGTERARPEATLDLGAGGAQWPMTSIQTAMATIITFSVRETKPSGTLLSPPTQAHLRERFSM